MAMQLTRAKVVFVDTPVATTAKKARIKIQFISSPQVARTKRHKLRKNMNNCRKANKNV